MNSLLKVSEATSLALHAMVYLAAKSEGLISAGDIASELKVSEAHLAKVLQRLAKAGLVESTRGPKGGFKLGRSPHEIALIDVYKVIEGPIPHEECLLGTKVCNGNECIFEGLIGAVNEMFADHLKSKTLSHLTGVFAEKAGSYRNGKSK